MTKSMDGENPLSDLANSFSGHEVRSGRSGLEVNGVSYRYNQIVATNGTKIYEIRLANGQTIYALEECSDCGYHTVVKVEVTEEGGSKVYKLK